MSTIADYAAVPWNQNSGLIRRPDSIEERNRKQRSKLQMLFLRGVCAYGLFTNLWYLGAMVLYFMVHGDNSSTFGFYPIIPALVVAAALVWTFRNSRIALCVLAGLTTPLGLLFAYNSIRFGLF